MNKKILSIFVMIMALSLFGVSCSNNSTTPNNSGTGGGGETQVKQITDGQIEGVLKEVFNGVKINASDTINTSEAKFANGEFAVSVNNNAKGNKTTAAANLKEKDADLTSKLDAIGVTLTTGQEYTVENTDGADGIVTLNITVKEGYKLPEGTTAIKIKITLTGSQATWEE